MVEEMMEEELRPLTVKEVAALLAVSERTVKDMIKRGQLSMINSPGVGWHISREAYREDLRRGFKPRTRFR